MSRWGKGTQRATPDKVDPESPEGRGIGASPRTQGIPSPIPGGKPHLANTPAVRHEPPIPEPRQEYRGVNAHGVPPGSHTTRERADNERGPNDYKPHPVQYRHPDRPPAPVPVYVVEPAGGPTVFTAAAPRSIAVPANTGEPVRLCGKNKSRVAVLLLNEDASHNIRFASRGSDLVSGAGAGGGALLPKAATSYLRLVTQDELWAISADSSVVNVSVITEFEQPT